MAAPQAPAATSVPDPLTAKLVADALKSGNAAEAERVLRKRLSEVPGDVRALTTLADIAADGGRVPQAMSLLYRALALAPSAHELRLRLSALHQRQAQYPAAMALLEEVPAALRQGFEVKAREAALLGQLGRRDEEIARYHELVQTQPRHPGLWMSLGTALNYAGRPDDAVRSFRRATQLRPTFGEAWWSLANLKSFRFANRDLRSMHEALAKDLNPEDAWHFHFALGRAYEQRDEYARSFEHYQEGNRVRATAFRPEQMRATSFVDAAIEALKPDLFAARQGAGAQSAEPIFVVGLQRSGSTLVEQVLASHPAIEGTSELLTMQHLWEDVRRVAATHGRGGLDQLGLLDAPRLRQIGEQYLERTRPFRLLGRPYFVDKLPANWMNLGLIRLALPNARIIDARRHPMACGFSNFKQHYATGLAFSYSLESIGTFYKDYWRFMSHFDQVQPGAVHRVINERLIDDPEGEVRRLLEFVGVPFDSACLDFHNNKRAVHTPSAEQVRKPINRDGVDYWKKYDQWLDPLRAALGPALEQWDQATS